MKNWDKKVLSETENNSDLDDNNSLSNKSLEEDILLKVRKNKRDGLILLSIGTILLFILVIVEFYSVPFRYNPELPDFSLLNFLGDQSFFLAFLWFFPFYFITRGLFMYSKKATNYLYYISLVMIGIGIPIFIYYFFFYSIPVELPNGDVLNIFPYAAQSYLLLFWSCSFLALYELFLKYKKFPRIEQIRNS